MVGLVYDSIVFKTENEIGQNVQEFIEEDEVHIVRHGSSSLEDQATLISERLAELEGLTDDITSSSGIKVVDTVHFFKGDKPAAQFEAGESCGGNYPCVGCACYRNCFSDFSHVTNCSQQSLRGIQKIALAGHFGRVPGHLKFYEELSSDQRLPIRQGWKVSSIERHPMWSPTGACYVATDLRSHAHCTALE